MWTNIIGTGCDVTRNILEAIKGLLESEENTSVSVNILMAHPISDFFKTLSIISQGNIHYTLKDVQDMTKLQLCKKLILAVNSLIVKRSQCYICHKYYELDVEFSGSCIRCQECSRPSHVQCTNSLYFPKGFYWKCPDCDDPENNNENLSIIFRNLRNTLEPSTKQEETVKSEPNGTVFEWLEHESSLDKVDNIKNDEFIFDDEKDPYDDNSNMGNIANSSDDLDNDNIEDDNVEDDLVCVPQRGYLCDICDFSTFNLEEFQSHVVAEEEKAAIFVQESISSPQVPNSCVKCQLSFETLPKLYEHVTKYHSRPSNFPKFDHVEWKFLMGLGQIKRSCSYCGTSFQSIQDWIFHMKINIDGDDDRHDNDQLILQCKECDPKQEFKTKEAFKIHISTFHSRGNKRFLCAFCSFDGSNVKDLNNHIKLEHDGNFNKCTECNFETWAHSVLRRHINVKHRKIKSFDCKHCSYTCTTKSALLTHRNEQHHSLLFFDNNGGEENNSELNSSTRSNNHSHFKCCFCSYQTASKKSFQEHFDEIHDGNRSQCLECEFKAPVISHLRRHIDSIHRGLKKFHCDQQGCDHKATTKQGLERHVRVKHLNLKDLKCPLCDYQTSAPDALKSHAKKYHGHQDEDSKEDSPKKSRIYFGNRTPIPMICRFCGYKAPTTNKLAAHFEECHPFEKPFWCAHCAIGYETYYGIQNHNRKDHSEERHLCPICGYSTHGPQYLKRHYRRKHPHMFEALTANSTNTTTQHRTENNPQNNGSSVVIVGGGNKISAEEKMKIALELKGLSEHEISERVKALIQLSEDGVWMCKKCQRRFDGKPKRALYSHIRERHFHMRHFKCKECNFLSYNRAEIQEHKEKHKADKPIHQCDLCGFICDNSTGLIRHKRGRFCQNSHLQRRKRDRDKMAKRMALAFTSSTSITTDLDQKPLDQVLKNQQIQDEDSAPASSMKEDLGSVINQQHPNHLLSQRYPYGIPQTHSLY